MRGKLIRDKGGFLQVTIPDKANRILNFVFIVLLLVTVRVWQLGVSEHDQRAQEARRPQRRTVVQKAARGMIVDRFGLPMAVNQVQYNAAVSFSQLREIPRVRWTKREGVKVKLYPRREHIRQLAEFLGAELQLDCDRVEDEIYSHAALFPNVPYVVKGDVGEDAYFRLKMAERKWLGLHAERVPRRTYPQGRVGGDVIGYMGAISRSQYDAIATEMGELRDYFDLRESGEVALLPARFANAGEAQRRLLDLEERAYSLRDQVGKAGVEGRFDEQLRGYCGRTTYQLDVYGSYVRALSGGKPPLAGRNITLSISAELQKFAEELLMQSEKVRDGKSVDGHRRPIKQPWIKGGAIVALDPNSGEVLALASYPRIDPNDFAGSGDSGQRLQWLEAEGHVAQVWEGKRPLSRERFNDVSHEAYEERRDVEWETYLATILPPDSPILSSLPDVSGAVQLQRAVEEVAALGVPLEGKDLLHALYERGDDLTREGCKAALHLAGYLRPLKRDYDKLLLLDLCRLFVDERKFTPRLMRQIGHRSLGDYHNTTRSMLVVRDAVRQMSRELFHDIDFAAWRAQAQAAFLKECRRLEAQEGKYQRPYLDHLDREQSRQFNTFWQENGAELIAAFLGQDVPSTSYTDHFKGWARELARGAHTQVEWYEAYQRLAKWCDILDSEATIDFLASVRTYEQLDRQLIGSYRYLRGKKERDLAAAFYPRYGFGYGRSYAFRQAAAQGSIFKLVTAYESVIQRYRQGYHSLNPLTMIDEAHRGADGWNVGYTSNGRPIPERYKGGRLLRTLKRNVGEIGVVDALEVSSNPYFALLAADHVESPEDINVAARHFSFGQRTGIDLPGEYPGHLPTDLTTNASGLYSYVVGQHSLVVTPLQTALMLSSLTNGGKTLRPLVVDQVVGVEPIWSPAELFSKRQYALRPQLDLLGIDFPLFSRAEGGRKERVDHLAAEVVHEIDLPSEVRTLLLTGMQRAINGARGNGRPSAVSGYRAYPWMVQDYREVAPQMVGKTCTAEVMENIDLDPEVGTNLYNHIWFGGVSFEPDQVDTGRFGRPELVVVVYLRYADYGREAAPLGGQMVKKWREIQAAHS